MSFEGYFARFEHQLTDFWDRRQNAPSFTRTFTIFGRPVQLATNLETVTLAAELSQHLFSTAPFVGGKEYKIQINVQPFQVSPGPLPDNLFNHIQYSGHDHWLAMQLGGWGHCQIDLASGEALAVVCSELGARPDYISRFLLNTILTNFMISSGLGLLHTTAVYRNNQILMMMADHNSGKSTTALHLTLEGYKFVSDSQIYIEQSERGLALYGFPVGRVKLRRDMLPNFPRLGRLLEAEPVRRETKFRLDLHLVDPDLVYDGVIRPQQIHLCLLSRNNREKTTLSTADRQNTLEAAMVNSLYYDSSGVWQKNFEQIGHLVQQANCYHLSVGTDIDDIIQVIDGLMG